LRPTIQIETAMGPLYRRAVVLPVISFVAEALERPPEVPRIECVSIIETAADKFVALARRIGAELAGLVKRRTRRSYGTCTICTRCAPTTIRPRSPA
jgi:hypothetical protein